MKHIVLTGGGTAGHVTPNIALIPTLKAAGYQISYIGSYEGIERKLIEEMGIPYYGISSGKLRRYFDPKNFSDPFRVLKGFHEAKKLLKTETFTDEEKEACQKLCDFIEITEYYILVMENIAYMAADKQDYSIMAENFLNFALESEKAMDSAREAIECL